MDAIGENFTVTKVLQSDVQDIFKITNNKTGKYEYESFPRSMELSCEDVLSYYD